MKIKEIPNNKPNMNKIISKKMKLGIISGILAFSLFTSATVTLLGIGNIISTHQPNNIQQKNNVLRTESLDEGTPVEDTQINNNPRQSVDDITPDAPIPEGKIMNPVTDFSPVKTKIETFPKRGAFGGRQSNPTFNGNKQYVWSPNFFPANHHIATYTIRTNYRDTGYNQYNLEGLSLDYLSNSPKTWIEKAQFLLNLNPADHNGNVHSFGYAGADKISSLPTFEIPLQDFVKNPDGFEINRTAFLPTGHTPNYLSFNLKSNIKILPKQQTITINNTITNTLPWGNANAREIVFHPLSSTGQDLFPTFTIKAPNFLQTYERFARIIMERAFQQMSPTTEKITDILLATFQANSRYNGDSITRHDIFKTEIYKALEAFNNPQTSNQIAEQKFWLDQNIDLSGVMRDFQGQTWKISTHSHQNPKAFPFGFRFVLGITNGGSDADFWTEEFKSIDVNLHNFLKQKVGPTLSNKISTTFPDFSSYFSTQNPTILNGSEYLKKQWLVSQFKKIVETDFFVSGDWTDLPGFSWEDQDNESNHRWNGRFRFGQFLLHSFEKQIIDKTFINIDFWKTKPEIIFNIPIEYDGGYFPQNDWTTIPFNFTSNVFVKQDPLPIPNLEGIDSPIVAFNIDVRDKIFSDWTELQLRFEDIFKPENYSKFFLDTPYDIRRLSLDRQIANHAFVFKYLQDPNSMIYKDVTVIDVDDFKETIPDYATPNYDLGETTKSAEYIQSAINGLNMEKLKSDVFNEYFKNVPGFAQNRITEFNLKQTNDTKIELQFKLNYVYEAMAIQMKSLSPNDHPVVFKLYNSIKVKPNNSQVFKLIINVEDRAKIQQKYLQPEYSPWKPEATSIIEKFTQVDVLTLTKQDLTSIELMKNTVVLKEEPGVIDYTYQTSLNGTKLSITPILTSYLDSWDLQTSTHFPLQTKTFDLDETLLSKSKIILDDVQLFNETIKNIPEDNFYNSFPNPINIIDKQNSQENTLFASLYNFIQTEDKTRERVLIVTDDNPDSNVIRNWLKNNFQQEHYYILVSTDWRNNYKALTLTLLNPNIPTTISGLSFYEKNTAFKLNDSSNSTHWEIDTKNNHVTDDGSILKQDDNLINILMIIIWSSVVVSMALLTLLVVSKNKHKRLKIISKKGKPKQ